MNAVLLDVEDRRRGGSPRRDAAWVRLIALALGAGIALELGLRGGASNALVSGGIVLVVIALATDRRVERSSARLAAVFATIPASFLSLRASPWLAATNMLAAGGLVGTAVLYARSGSIFDTTPGATVRRVRAAARRAIAPSPLLRPLLPARASSMGVQRAARVGRALLIAIPILVVVVALLASADAVFARLLLPNIDPGPLVGHVVLAALLTAGVLGLVAAALGDGDDRTRGGSFGSLEIATMLGCAATVLGFFVIAQVVALTATGRRFVGDSGMTPAQYARSGFFQLCWATAILVAFLALVRVLAAPAVMRRPVVRLLAALVPALAIGLVVSSGRRLALYDQAYGLTMLRLWAVGAAIWMGGVLLMIALRNVGVGGAHNWLIGGALVWALAVVGFANVADPEAFIVRHNIARAESGAALDPAYLGGLSDDAVPAIARAVERGSSGVAIDSLRAALRCGDDATGAASVNIAVARAADARRRACV